jgi:hypothetical protein
MPGWFPIVGPITLAGMIGRISDLAGRGALHRPKKHF